MRLSVHLIPWIDRGHALDLRVLRGALRLPADGLPIRFFAQISRLGNGLIWYALLIAIPILYGAQAAIQSLHIGLTALVAVGVYSLLKRGLKRPRPFIVHEDVIARVPALDEFSFPSGHTLQAVAFTLLTWQYFPVLGALLLPFTILIAMSRVVLGVHYPTDVLAGGLLGAAIASLSWSLGQQLRLA